MEYLFSDIIRQIKALDKHVLKKKPKMVRYPSLFLLYIDLFFLKTIIIRPNFIYRYRADLTSSKEVLIKSNRQDLIVLIISVLMMCLIAVPKQFLFAFWVFPIGFYRLLDIWCQRMRSVFVDPYFYRKTGHLIDPSRSFVWAAINYAEIIFIFALFYKYLPCGSFNRNLDNLNSIYFSFITITTVGFGDIYPSYDVVFAKILVGLEVVIGISFIIVVFGALISDISKFSDNKKDHSPIWRRSNYLSIKSRHLITKYSGRKGPHRCFLRWDLFSYDEAIETL